MALVELTLFGIDDKVAYAVKHLRMLEPPEGYCLKFSGGKDSQVIYHLAKEAGVSFRAQYDLTTVDPPELIHFIRDNYPDVVVNRPKTTMWRLIVKKRIPPTRLIRYCCDVFKEQGCPWNNRIITGVRWQESPRRKGRSMIETCQRDKGKEFINPIVNWSEAEVWEYLSGRPHCSLYDEGWNRIGCIGYPMAKTANRERELAKYPKFAEAYLRAFDRMLQAIKEHKGANWQESTKWKTAEDVYNWWLYGAEKIWEGNERHYDLFYGDYYEQFDRSTYSEEVAEKALSNA